MHYPGVVLTQEEFDALPADQKDEAKSWIGKEFNKQVLTEMMEKPYKKTRELNLPLYCGEYGVLKGAPEEDRLRWYNDMMEIFKENSVGSANWNYKSGSFGLVNGDGSKNQDLIEIVVGQNNMALLYCLRLQMQLEIYPLSNHRKYSGLAALFAVPV